MDLFKYTPQFDLPAVEAMAQSLYGLTVTAKPLASERDQNFRLTDPTGKEYVLKIANGMEEPGFLDAQQAIMLHLAAKGIDFCPQVKPLSAGSYATKVDGKNGMDHTVRLVSFLPGTPVGDLEWCSDGMYRDLGQKLGQMDRALVDFEHPAAHRTFHWDLAQGIDVVNKHRHLISDPEKAAAVDALMSTIEKEMVPLLPKLRQSVIHSDANDYNVMADPRSQTITGIIDFGDMVHSYTVANLAIGAAYMLLDQPDPLARAAKIVEGYHKAFPLTEDELAALWGLMLLRICTSICMAAVQLAERPDDPYLAISQQPIANTLPSLLETPYRLATAIFREACGLEPFPQSSRIVNWIKKQTLSPILGRDLAAEETLTLDLSVGSPLLPGDIHTLHEPELTKTVFGMMAEAGAKVSIGRYNEPRLIYSHPTLFQTGPGPLDERRSIHIGLDLFDEAGTPIYAPLDGSIALVDIADGAQDYGGSLTVAHFTDDGETFYTLYGHLSHESVKRWQVGQFVKAGEELCQMGIPAENGGWTPHLHFQILIDNLDLTYPFAGVCRPSRRNLWQSLCPDPNLLVRIPEERLPDAGDHYAETFATRKQALGRNLSVSYGQKGIKMVRGWKQYLWDHQGLKFLDAYNNVPHVGHCHPHVVAAGQRQMGVLNTNTRYLSDSLNRYAERLAATLPDPLNVCFFVNSASEANELALRLARAHTGAKDMIVNESAYHGHTTGLIDISPYKHGGPGGAGAPDWVHTAAVADVYRGKFKANDPHAGQKYATEVQEIISKIEADGKRLSGFIAETCPSVGGQIILPDGYLAAVYDAVKSAGGVAIADEVQTGYGRLGTHFYAFQAHDVVPDIVVLGKPIGNGHPIGAVVTTAEIADAFHNGMEFFATFGGNNVSCEVGLAVLEVLEQEDLQGNALRVGQQMLDRMGSWVDQFDLVGDVRGSGFFMGVELVRDRKTLEPATAEASFIKGRMRDHHILIGTDGPYDNVLKIRPPMPFDEGNGEFLVDTLEHILKTMP